MELETVADELYVYLEDKGFDDLEVHVRGNVIEIYLDLPNTDNYNSTLAVVENFFDRYYVEDFEIDGDYEGLITLEYIGSDEDES